MNNGTLAEPIDVEHEVKLEANKSYTFDITFNNRSLELGVEFWASKFRATYNDHG